MSTGFLYRPRDPLDFVAGAETGITPVILNPKKNWEDFLPPEEKQKGVKGDSMACVTYSALNALEAQFQLIKDKLSKTQLKTLTDLGYIVDGHLSLSDRFTAKMSGTTKEGNYLVSVWDSIRHDGVLPESDWPFVLDEFSWKEYYKDIPQKLKDKAKKFLDIFEVKYEWLSLGNFREHLSTAPIQVVVKVDKNWGSSEIVPPTLMGSGHAVLLYASNKYLKIYDHYFKFKKTLAGNYPIVCAMRGVLSIKKEEVKQSKKLFYFDVDLQYASPLNLPSDVVNLQDCLKYLGFMSKSVNSTGYYGNITAEAVKKFQEQYKIASKDELARLQGKYFGPKTRAKLNSMF